MARLNLNIKEGTLEVEGEETFVATVYADFKEQLAIGVASRNLAVQPSTASISTNEASVTEPKQAKKPRGSKSKESFTILKDLDLSDKANSQSLREFYDAKKPGNAMERNVVFVYYLKMIAGVEVITLDHVYSCYKNVEAKVPSLRQSLRDTAFHKGYIDTSSLDSIKLGIPGENFVEQDLPVAAK